MKPSFLSRTFNGPFEDPGIYIRILREGRALIFDLGFTTSLSPRDILKTSDIFISHTHMDHFIGFDTILRVCLKKPAPLRLYGPEGFIDCIEGRLNSYSWNVIRDYPLSLEVSEIRADSVHKALFKTQNSFTREDLHPEPFTGLLVQEPLYRVSAAVLDHHIPCLAFSLEEDYHINIDKAELRSRSLPPGPWLNQLKNDIRAQKNDGIFTIGNRKYSFFDLKGVANITRGQKLSYVVDAAGTSENIEKIVELVRGSDTLFIEAYFLDADRRKARDRYHLTAKEAGSIAREAGVGRLELIHFSPRYADSAESLKVEALEEFNRA